ncbi:hypothetical protein SUGI_0981070 [Cryptomeria japonica]|nr:hypothetical protein SUGI_0981070 [Cryptomeria japonica]
MEGRSAFSRNNLPQQQSSRRGLVIEEIPDDHENAYGTKQKPSQDPIIEDPDDNDDQEQRTQMQSRWNGYQANNNSYGRHAPSQSFTFQSSSVSYGGPNGMYYTSSTTRRAGPDGVIEEEHREADSTTGNATQRISRGIRDKGHSYTKKRHSDRKIDTMETLHNLNEDEIAQFNEDWERKAEKSLPGWKKSHAGMLDGGKKTISAARPALPSNEPDTNKEKEYNAANGKKNEGLSQKSRRWFGQRKD